MATNGLALDIDIEVIGEVGPDGQSVFRITDDRPEVWQQIWYALYVDTLKEWLGVDAIDPDAIHEDARERIARVLGVGIAEPHDDF